MKAKDFRDLTEAYYSVYEKVELDESEKWIQGAIKHPGALHQQLGVPEGENIPAEKLRAAAKKGGKLGKRARLAQTLKGLHNEDINIDEAKQESGEEDWRKSEIRNLRRYKQTGTTTPYTDRIVAHTKSRGVKKPKGRKNYNEEIDIYDFILSHLLDEGYTDTIEGAEVIMVNMSENWREEIVEKMINPFQTKTDYNNPQGNSPALKARQKRWELEKNEPGSQRQKKQTRRSKHLDALYGAARTA